MVHYLDLEHKEILDITDRYSLEQVRFKPVEQGAGNTNYLLYSSQGRYILTVFEFGHERARKLCKLLDLLEELDIQTNRVERTDNGETITTFQDRPAIIKPFIRGEVVRDLDVDMINQVGAEIARLHQVPPAAFLRKQHTYGIEFMLQVMDQDVEQIMDAHYRKWLTDRIETYQQAISPDLPRGLIHGDVFFDNVLFDGKDLKALIDFEESCDYYLVFDLGMAILGLCMPDMQIDLPLARALVSGYQTTRMLNESEQNVLKTFVDYAACATSIWRYWKFNVDTPMADRADSYQFMASHADAAEAMPNEKFMNAVFS